MSYPTRAEGLGKYDNAFIMTFKDISMTFKDILKDITNFLSNSNKMHKFWPRSKKTTKKTKTKTKNKQKKKKKKKNKETPKLHTDITDFNKLFF